MHRCGRKNHRKLGRQGMQKKARTHTHTHRQTHTHTHTETHTRAHSTSAVDKHSAKLDRTPSNLKLSSLDVSTVIPAIQCPYSHTAMKPESRSLQVQRKLVPYSSLGTLRPKHGSQQHGYGMSLPARLQVPK